MQRRRQRHVERIAGISERIVDHVETLQPGEVLDSVRSRKVGSNGAANLWPERFGRSRRITGPEHPNRSGGC
jgi:hypothetical protein